MRGRQPRNQSITNRGARSKSRNARNKSVGQASIETKGNVDAARGKHTRILSPCPSPASAETAEG